ncbi:MAG: spermine/spermidine synthase domain-containing protein [Ramlibacter sp.]
MAGSFENLHFAAPFVQSHDGVLSLHFTLGETQSSMRADCPDELQIDYTRTMMGFLLLQPQARDIVMIGLGGGSMAKFCYRHLPSARITVVENNPGVIALRQEFRVPDDDERFRVVAADGAVYLEDCATSIDVLLVDGFDENGQPPALCSQAFYGDCRRALAPGGVLVVNLHVDDADHDVRTRRIADAFDGNAMQTMASGQANCVVFARRGEPATIDQLRGEQWMRALSPEGRQQLKNDMDHIGWNACALRSRDHEY